MNVNTREESSPQKEDVTRDEEDHLHYVYSAARTPPPPGFSLADGFVLMGENRKGAESAPPIGFGLRTTGMSPLQEEQSFGSDDFSIPTGRKSFQGTAGGATSTFGSSSTTSGGPSSSLHYSHNNMERMRMMQRPNPQNRELLQPSDFGIHGAAATARRSTRSSSFTNLAAVLGQGLAESMGDSLQDEHKNIAFSGGGGALSR